MEAWPAPARGRSMPECGADSAAKREAIEEGCELSVDGVTDFPTWELPGWG